MIYHYLLDFISKVQTQNDKVLLILNLFNFKHFLNTNFVFYLIFRKMIF